jgi:poly(A) polymerase
VRFGRKVVEVSTFRRQAEPQDGDPLIRRDNTFGTPEEDAFRRDFTVNALFYDIASFSVIDYVGGLADLEQRLIRTIGDPATRFREDPVRMLRAVALAARLGFTIHRDTLEAIRVSRGEILKSSPARLIEEFYKILRQGAARRSFELLHELGMLSYLLPEAEAAIAEGGERLLGSLSRLDDYRNAGLATAEGLSNPLLMGTLLVPLGLPLRRVAVPPRPRPRAGGAGDELPRPPEPPLDVAAEMEALGGEAEEAEGDGAAPAPAAIALPFARRDLDRLRLLLAAQRRLRELHRSPRVKQLLAGRDYFDEALRWMEIHGGVEGQELAAHWRSLDTGDVLPPGGEEPGTGEEEAAAALPPGPGGQRRRRRRRRRRGGAPLPSKGEA